MTVRIPVNSATSASRAQSPAATLKLCQIIWPNNDGHCPWHTETLPTGPRRIESRGLILS